MIKRLFILGLALLLNSTFSYASPNNCFKTDKVTAIGNQLRLNTQDYFLIKNIANKTILLNHVKPLHQGMNAGWMSKLSPQKVSILAVNRVPFDLTCMKLSDYKQLNCQSVLKVCVYKSKQKIAGSYWVVENINRSAVRRAFVKRHIKLLD